MDQNFLRSYAGEVLMELISREDRNQFCNPELFTVKDHLEEFQTKYGTLQQRAAMIDKLFGIANQPEL